MNEINFQVYKNTMKRSDGFAPVENESGYTKLIFHFKSGDDWENCELITICFIKSAREITRSFATVHTSLKAEFEVPRDVVRSDNKLILGLQGTYTENGETRTVITNVVGVYVNSGLMVEEGVAQNVYESLLAALNEDLASKANAADVYTKAETDGALSRKVDTSTFNYQLGNVIATLNKKADAQEVYKKSEVYSKSEVDEAVNNKTIEPAYSFSPKAVYKDKLVRGWKNYVPVDDPTYGDPVFGTLEGAVSLIIPIEGKDGSVSWSTDIAHTAQVVALGTDMKRVENMPAPVDGTTASIDLTRDFTRSDVKYLCFWTTDVKSIEFNNILPNKSLYKSSEASTESGRFEITNDKPITPDFNPPYLYSAETPLYIYPQSLFNKPFNMVYNTGVNSVVQNGHNGFSIKNVSGLPMRTEVTIADGKKVLFIGDSYTAHEVYHKVVYDTITSLGKSISLLGTWGDGVYRHEGRSGWRNYTFAKCANQTNDSAFSGGTSIPNPFYNEEKGQFDFEYYVQKKINNVVPDIVFVNLGANDMARGDHKSEADICEYISIIVDSIKSVSSSIKVVYWLPNQFPVGINAGYDRWQGTIEYSKILIKNKQALGIDELCPVRYAFDCKHDGKFVTENINGHDMIYLADITHPSNLGYEHIAQMIVPYIHD